jgi:hypothetical protein
MSNHRVWSDPIRDVPLRKELRKGTDWGFP